MKLKYIKAFLDMAERFGQTSEATRLKVGCLLYKGGIIAEGCNGMPPKWPTEHCEDGDGASLPEVRHAEIAALEKLWNKPTSAQGAIAFISHSPCLNCSIKMLTAGITAVYYRHDYRDDSGIQYLCQHGIHVEKIGE